jgi:hypothetical protein
VAKAAGTVTGVKMRRGWSWTKLQEHRAGEVLRVVHELRDWFPLTLRQIHYRLVEMNPAVNWCKHTVKEAAPYVNDKNHYNALSALLKYMRLEDRMPFDLMEDNTRRTSIKRGWTDCQEFVDAWIEAFLKKEFERCLVQSQERYVELWVEKHTLTRVFEEAADPFCLRVVTRRGYNSITYEADYFKRATAAIERGQIPTILYLGDHDPSGKDMLKASLTTLKDEMGLQQLDHRTVALTLEQVEQYDLPLKYDAVKPSDPRYKSYVKRFGSTAWELDALHPNDLKRIAEQAIREVLDMDAFEYEQALEQKDKDRIQRFRDRIRDAIKKAREEF